MTLISLEHARPDLVSRLLSRLVFRAWPQKRRIDVRDLNDYLRRDIGIDR